MKIRFSLFMALTLISTQLFCSESLALLDAPISVKYRNAIAQESTYIQDYLWESTKIRLAVCGILGVSASLVATGAGLMYVASNTDEGPAQYAAGIFGALTLCLGGFGFIAAALGMLESNCSFGTPANPKITALQRLSIDELTELQGTLPAPKCSLRNSSLSRHITAELARRERLQSRVRESMV